VNFKFLHKYVWDKPPIMNSKSGPLTPLTPWNHGFHKVIPSLIKVELRPADESEA